MGLIANIKERRAYRCLEKVEITDKDIHLMQEAAKLAPSCFNNQPWRYIFITDKEMLIKMQDVLSKGNKWAYDASMIVAVYSEKELDCLIKEREYFLFDTGIATGFMILQATELGLVAHPIAGYSEKKAKKLLEIPDNMTVITLLIVGKHDLDKVDKLDEDERKKEMERPERKKDFYKII